jgi:hypothetical protein
MTNPNLINQFQHRKPGPEQVEPLYKGKTEAEVFNLIGELGINIKPESIQNFSYQEADREMIVRYEANGIKFKTRAPKITEGALAVISLYIEQKKLKKTQAEIDFKGEVLLLINQIKTQAGLESINSCKFEKGNAFITGIEKSTNKMVQFEIKLTDSNRMKFVAIRDRIEIGNVL